MTPKKKLIEVALPLDAINKASAREKSIRHGHPSTLHLWWARRPLAAARAVIFSQMVDDPSAYVDVLRADPKLRRKAEAALKARLKLWQEARALAEKAKEAGLPVAEPGPAPTLDDMLADQERQRLFRIIEKLVLWESTTDETVLQAARDEIWQSWRRTCAENAGHPRAKELFDRHKLPAFHDPFAGGGALPLEAQRLGLESYASDLNPVAVLINKAMIEIPPKFAGRPPVNPDYRKSLFSLGAPASSRPHPPEHKEWFSRGYLPHFDVPDLLQSITFRLADSLPQEALDEMARELAAHAETQRQTERERRIATYLDAGHGACWLKDPRVAALVENALLHFDGQRYRLLAWCVMPNHVHALVETKDGFPLSEIVHSWKSFTANEANKILDRKGEFWQREYHDRFIRDDDHYRNAVVYIESNPVKAGLAKSAEAWRYSSAWSYEEKKAGKDAGAPSMWRGAQGLAEDVRYYGKWMRDEAEKRIGHLYPKVEITAGMVKERPDLKRYEGQKLTVIAWLWARTVKSPNPAFAHVDVPLASTFMLSTKEGKEAYVEPFLFAGSAGFQPAKSRQDGGAPSNAPSGYCFTVKVGKPKDAEAAKNGTKLSRGANFQCVMSGTPITGDYVKAEGKAGRLGARLMASVAEGERGRVYLPPTETMEAVARQAEPEWEPETPLPDDARNFWTLNYGLSHFRHLFTNRQLVTLTAFSDLVQRARERVTRDALAAGLPADDKSLRGGGTGATAYADTVGVYLAFVVEKLTESHSTICTWSAAPKNELVVSTFRRQALPMTWDFAEANPFAESSGSLEKTVAVVARVIVMALPASTTSYAQQADAANQTVAQDKVISTDPPYYDNIGYADLSDFFYVWLRRSMKPIFPDLFATLAVPKAEELVATPYRHGSKEKAEAFFLDGMTQAMRRIAEQTHPAFPVTLYYAFKQSETENEGEGGTISTGWDTFLDAVIHAGFGISGTWPVRTEREGRSIGIGTNALASSIVLVCRKRAANAPTATRREFVTALKAELPKALALLQRGNIAPVDLAQAAIGPGMAVYTRYAKVLDAEGKPLPVREALSLINQTLDEALAEQEGDFDADSRWALAWFEQYGFIEGEYGVAETLSKAKNTSVQGLKDAGILDKKSPGGKVRLLRPNELTADWDPTIDARLTAWEMVHHLIRVLEDGGESGASVLAAKVGTKAEIARELCYRLYTLCERKKRAVEALSYNGLVQSWPEITRLAREGGTSREAQTTIFDTVES